MNTIQLLYAESLVTRTMQGESQRLAFCLSLENLAYEKTVEIHWGNHDGPWSVLPAHFVRTEEDGREIWEAEAHFQTAADNRQLPGDVTFAARCAMAGADCWDSNRGNNYTMKADSGVLLPDAFPLLSIKAQPLLRPDDTYLPVTVAVHQSLRPQRVFLHWSTDNWRTTHTADCYYWRRHWEKHHPGGTRHPLDGGTTIWVSHLPVHDAYRIAYAIGCETPSGTVWDNNAGKNHHARHDRLKVLTLNLHCCQEADQDAKLSTIARAIDDHDVDIVCLQEVAEPWESDTPPFDANTAKIIRDRLKRHYHLLTDWSHRGFLRYREGSAILTRHEILLFDSGYVSADQDPDNIHARKIVMARVNVPYVGHVNVYSVHLSWWKDGFREQFENLRAWARQKHADGVAATLLLGDFNARTGSKGYRLATHAGDFEDQHLKATRLHAPPSPDPAASPALPDDGRIDFIFLKRDSALEVKFSKALFTPADYGPVSDHPGYYAEFEPPG